MFFDETRPVTCSSDLLQTTSEGSRDRTVTDHRMTWSSHHVPMTQTLLGYESLARYKTTVVMPCCSQHCHCQVTVTVSFAGTLSDALFRVVLQLLQWFNAYDVAGTRPLVVFEVREAPRAPQTELCRGDTVGGPTWPRSPACHAES